MIALPPQSYHGTPGGKPAALSALIPNSLYIGLTARPSDVGTFHWFFYHHLSAEEGGWKMHITNLGSGGKTWMSEYTKTRSITGTMFLVCLIEVVSAERQTMHVSMDEKDDQDDAGRKSTLMSIVQDDDAVLNEVEGLTCRVWIGRACKRLQRRGCIDFGDWDKSEEQMIRYAQRHWEDTEFAHQPRPIVALDDLREEL